ncbi:PTS system, beta-glucosides-specific IIC component [Paenibacillus sophorae]|uniref:Beta-glucoside-specific PTS transporter subunit IIABC n=1 Tax=Paenibacillus sophorae TaxID=1333845 RepID=A0A1H8TT92_9BACL|nr:beta-glucoside-specific PTS transporter subunit IIABC [Paenibacillus sophorae]QWU18003.1 beta-glucoside-specific PTS transporter subunit IIABC [Paenibacillus sophorae]SEO93658.1 PTS system, beta-glucosides-specific IIC component [Paenibacillus sophorae]
MSKKYEKLAQDIVEKIGGSENVSTLTHCMTRLRFALNDNIKADQEGIKALDGVINVIESGGQFQVVIGTHVEEVYEEVVKHLKPLGNSDVKSSKRDKVGRLDKLIDFVSGTFSPLVPAIAGAGMIKALLALLLLFGLVSRESQTYYVVSFIADAAFYFLPFLLAYSAASKLKCTPAMAMVLAGILLHPSLIQLRTDGKAVEVFAIPMQLVNYGSSVVPILLIVWAQSYIERLFKRIIPDSIKIIFVPMFTIIVTGIIGLTVLGPLGSFVGGYMAAGFELLGSYGGWLIVFLVATLWPILVMFGIHHSIVPLSLAQITTLGYENIIGPGAIISNISQGVAALVVGWRTKDSSFKQIANTSGITGLMGITEPALYGVSLPKKYPLIAAMIGGACGGLYAGLMGVIRYATGASGIPAIPLYIGENIWHLYNILIALVITAVVTAVVTYFLSLKYEKETPEQNKVSTKDEIITLKNTVITSPIKGNVIPLKDVKDEAFASEAMGKGIAIEPSEGKVVAPFDGKIVSLFPKKHAIGLLSDDGIEILIHIGLNTVRLNGKYYEAHVVEGQRMTKGQTLITFDLEKIREEGYVTQTPVIVTNTYSYADVITNNSIAITDFNHELLVLKV